MTDLRHEFRQAKDWTKAPSGGLPSRAPTPASGHGFANLELLFAFLEEKTGELAQREGTASSIHLSAMPNFQNNQSLSGPVYLIDDPIVTDTVFEAPDPFLPSE